MGSVTVEMLTAAEARKERNHILHELGMNIESLEQHAAHGLLDAKEFRAWRRIQTLNWLLDEDA